MSLSDPNTFASYDVPSERRQRISTALSITWWFVSNSPSSVITTPEPDAVCLPSFPSSRSLHTTRTYTSEGKTFSFACSTTSRKSVGCAVRQPVTAHASAAAANIA